MCVSDVPIKASHTRPLSLKTQSVMKMILEFNVHSAIFQLYWDRQVVEIRCARHDLTQLLLIVGRNIKLVPDDWR